MVSTRDRALTAAVEVLGSQGLRYLTHARIDDGAGLPRGSTSNYFRTRAALIAGVIDWVARHELGDIDPGFDPAVSTPDDLVDAFCDLVTLQTGPARVRTIARYLLFLEAARGGDEFRAPLVANRGLFEQWTTSTLAALGAPHPKTAALALMAFGEGLILHRLTVDDSAETRPAIALVVRACLAPEPGPTSEPQPGPLGD
ncbi:TetR family transcriptional regulator [Cryobacterium frigoriphilum]|uniref:TetR family transcriptional regulator n=1 Tax=Cryobacterium frigoriphilum TaxID=1259150 RepID=A0A4R9A9C8_9MICO|nr:TetR family transcriptional regulator [Cryobacterium frigoriphilum]TFD54556.1 TetR family transcriptional regulator [Cryobacterium frigoriphilum]